MANELMKVTMFLLVAHTLIFFAQQSVLLDSQTGNNPHEDFIDEFLSGDFSDTVSIDDTSGIISGTIALAAKAIDFIGFMAGITVSPFLLFINSPLPTEFATLFGVVFAFLEVAAIAYFTRGLG